LLKFQTVKTSILYFPQSPIAIMASSGDFVMMAIGGLFSLFNSQLSYISPETLFMLPPKISHEKHVSIFPGGVPKALLLLPQTDFFNFD
jgi:hypothetical protein